MALMTNSAPPAPRGQARDLAADASAIERSDRLRWLQLLLGVVLFVAIEVVAGLASGLLAQLLGDSASAEPVGRLIGAVIASLLALAGFWLIVGPVGRLPRRAMLGRGSASEPWTGVLVGAVAISASIGLIALLGGMTVDGPGADQLAGLAGALAIGLGAGVLEEIVFRGIVLRVLDAWLGWAPALVISSLVFGLMHVLNPNASLWDGLALALSLGFLCGAAFLLTRRIWMPIGIHVAWNFVQTGIFSASVSGNERPGILATSWHGPDLLTGGAFGVEGSLATVLVGFASGLALLAIARRCGRLTSRVHRGQAEARGAASAEVRDGGGRG